MFFIGDWLIGLGGPDNNGSGSQPVATFIPEPSVSYNIQPSVKYTVTPAQYEPGTIIDVKKVGASVEVDFTKYPKGVVKIVHSSNGKLTIQK